MASPTQLHNVEDEDSVTWSVFDLTHNPRVEDWPVRPIETLRSLVVGRR